MQLLRLCFILIAVLLLGYCNKDEDRRGGDAQIWVEREVVDCCNPWGDDITDTTHEELVMSLFENNYIPVFETRSRDTGQRMYCLFCCGCPSGVFVGMRIKRDDLDKAITLEFSEE